MAAILTALVAALHLLFMILEMFLWQTPIGLKIFNLTPDIAKNTAVLAENMGLYNGILAAGLIWTFFIKDLSAKRSTRIFFLLSIIVAGIFGAITAKFSILFTQALPAFLAFLAVRYNTDS